MKTMTEQDSVVCCDNKQADERITARVKHCPQCSALLFEDMDVCYRCLYDFSKDANKYREDFSLTSGSEKGGGMPYYDDVLPESYGGVLADERNEIDAYDFCNTTRNMTSEKTNQKISSTETTTLALSQDCPADELSAVRVRVAFDCADVTCSVPEDGLAVGRSNDNDIILHSRMMSRYHLKIFQSVSGAVVIDQGATNPARVNGACLTGSHCLQSSEVVDVCGICITILFA